MDKKFLDFVLKEKLPKTMVYSVRAVMTDDELGEIRWWSAWRHYVFIPTLEEVTIYSDRCILEIHDFMNMLNEEHKAKIVKSLNAKDF